MSKNALKYWYDGPNKIGGRDENRRKKGKAQAIFNF